MEMKRNIFFLYFIMAVALYYILLNSIRQCLILFDGRLLPRVHAEGFGYHSGVGVGRRYHWG
jgi:hypothetical protein